MSFGAPWKTLARETAGCSAEGQKSSSAPGKCSNAARTELEAARQEGSSARQAGDAAGRELETVRSRDRSAGAGARAPPARAIRDRHPRARGGAAAAGGRARAARRREPRSSTPPATISKPSDARATKRSTPQQTLTSKVDQERRAREDEGRRQAAATRALDEARVAERQAQLAVVERLLAAIRSMDAGTIADRRPVRPDRLPRPPRRRASRCSSSTAASCAAGRASDSRTETSLQATARKKGCSARCCDAASRSRRPTATVPPRRRSPRCPADRAAIAVPLLVASQAVAVLYADDAADGSPATPSSWPEAMQILGRHASVNLAHLTAARAAEAMRRSMPQAAPAAGSKPERHGRRQQRPPLCASAGVGNQAL